MSDGYSIGEPDWPGRQAIFSSHNANLVVDGDADLVLECAYVTAGDQSTGHIKREGAATGRSGL